MEPAPERRERTSISEAALEAAYATYDSDPRVHGPDDYDAFRAGIAAYISALPEPSEAAFVEALDRIARFAKVRFDYDFKTNTRIFAGECERVARQDALKLFRQAKGGA